MVGRLLLAQMLLLLLLLLLTPQIWIPLWHLAVLSRLGQQQQEVWRPRRVNSPTHHHQLSTRAGLRSWLMTMARK
jgi:hypothetical protein